MNEAEESNIDSLGFGIYLPPLQPDKIPSVVTIVGNLLQNAIEALKKRRKNKSALPCLTRGRRRVEIR
jgi:sensor histidine kinase regulating citrate/malate metabolism